LHPLGIERHEPEALAARQDRRQEPLRHRRSQYQERVLGRLFERLEQSVADGGRHDLGVRDDEDLHASFDRPAVDLWQHALAQHIGSDVERALPVLLAVVRVLRLFEQDLADRVQVRAVTAALRNRFVPGVRRHREDEQQIRVLQNVEFAARAAARRGSGTAAIAAREWRLGLDSARRSRS
jgi:hypothetical protein